MRLFARCTGVALLLGNTAVAAVYEVGPGKSHPSIGSVPWESLQPGDTVLIYWRPDPYREKWVICRQGTAALPITVRGIAGPAGELPVIDGNGAVTRTALNYWNEVRGLIKIGGANTPPDLMPRHIVVENLDLRSARPPYTFTAANGSTQTYASNAAAMYIEKGENITVRNCRIHDSGNGLFISSSDSSVSRDILIEKNYVYDNGIEGSIYHHNSYTAAAGLTFQFNRYGPLRAGCLGNNLKDRSAGLVVRYNWIEGANRQLDLVDAEDSILLRGDARYRETFVYGNILIEPDGAGNRQIAHYGGDSGTTAAYRKGMLYFYNNTIVSTRTDRTTLLRLSTNDEGCDFRNNIAFVSADGGTLSLLDSAGVLYLSRNWFKPGRVASFGTFGGAVVDDGTSVVGQDPGFLDAGSRDFELRGDSMCINRGAELHPAVLPSNGLARQYSKHLEGRDRAADGTPDIGAYEYASSGTR
ncbi:MAG: polysaccharide-degrading enzyme, partial [Acidobacteria bacterium]|nr:polysaccharide-degrading enzyme [Acidobacteriota bacterium]